MQMQSNFFYVDNFSDIITQLIKPIALTNNKDIFISNCNKLLDYLNNYRRKKPDYGFSKCIKNLITTNKLTDIDDCCAFIEQLKEIPTIYSEWRQETRNMLNLIDTETANNRLVSKTEVSNNYRKNLDIKGLNRENRQETNDIYNKLSPKRNEPNGPVSFETQTIPRKFTNKIKRTDNDNENVDKSVRGLPRKGLQCYIIAALQCLYDDMHFRQVVLKSQISGSNAKKMKAVKEIFKHLNGDINLNTQEIINLYNSIGYNGIQKESDRIRRQIRSWFIPVDDVKDRFEVEYLSTFGDFKSVISDFYYQNKYNNSFSPRIIDINIGRGSENGKIDTYIQIPEKLKIGELEFLLTSATAHYGSLSDGHYISYVKKGCKWIKRNDNHITVHNWADIKDDVGCNCTFLRYEKVS